MLTTKTKNKRKIFVKLSKVVNDKMKHQKDKIMIVIEVKVVITNEKALKKLIKFGKINSGGTRKLVGEN